MKSAPALHSNTNHVKSNNNNNNNNKAHIHEARRLIHCSAATDQLATTTNDSFVTDKSDSVFLAAQDLMPGGVSSPVRAFKSVGGAPVVFDRVKGERKNINLYRFVINKCCNNNDGEYL